MTQLETVLGVLSDGEWHSLSEIEDVILLGEQQTREVIAFLFEYDLVNFDSEKEMVKMKKPFRDFLIKTLC